MGDKKGYDKLAGGAGTHGADYQIEILLLYLLEGYLKDQNFRLSTENKLGGKFDDVIFETEEKSILLQAKHKENPKDKKQQLAFNDLFPSTGNKDEFNIFMYAKSFAEITKNFNNIDKIIICTNVNVSNDKKNNVNNFIFCPETIGEEHTISCNKTIYCLKENCKQIISENVKGISEECVVQFLNKFQLIVASDGDIDARIQKIVQNIPLVANLGNADSLINFVRKKVKDWFKGKKGVYLTFQHIETYLLYFRSQYFISELQKLQVEFQLGAFEDQYTCCIIQDKEFVNLHIMKSYQHLEQNEVLIVNPKDPINIQIKTVTAFTSNEIVSLIVPLFQPTYESLKSIIDNILKETSNKIYKSIVFITDDLKIFHQLSSYTQIKITCAKVAIEYDSFSGQTKTNLLKKQVNFQGQLVPFGKILPENITELNAIFDEPTFYSLFNGRLLEINKHCKEITLEHYVERSFECVRNALPQQPEKERTISEQELYEHVILKGTRKVILVSDGPGMGKSTLLSKLQQLLNQDCFWIVKINLNECTNIFKDYLTSTKDELSLEKLLERLNSPFATKFEREIFIHSKKVILLFDGYDEISPDYGNVVLNLIKSCINKDHIMRIVLTTRPYCQTDIESNIEADTYKLNKFEDKDQQMFLYNYWTKELQLTQDTHMAKCKEYVKNVSEELFGTVGNNLSDLIGIPLQCKMIAEIFKDDCSQYIESMEIGNKNTLKQINITDMYHMFIEKKNNILLDEKFFVAGNIEVQNNMIKQVDEAKKEHVKIALKTLFNETEHKYFSIFQTDSNIKNRFLLRIGILKESNDSLIFIHKTFAEYFVAVYLCGILCEPKVSKGFLSFFVNEILFKRSYRTLLLFLNILLKDKSISKIVRQTCSRCISNCSDLVWLLTFFGYDKLLRLILDECYYCHHCQNFVPAASKLFHSLLTLKRNFTFNQNHQVQPFELARNEWAKLLINRGVNVRFDINAEYFRGTTPLHFAVKEDNLDVVQTLIDAGADINDKDIFGDTSFLLACDCLSIRCVNCLILHGCDINCIKSSSGCNGLHYMMRWHPTSEDEINTMKLIINYLLQKGLEVNSRDKDGNTPLHYAADAYSVNAVKILMDNNADINAKNKFGDSALNETLLSLKDCSNEMKLNVLQVLIDSGADINNQDHLGDTPFLRACSFESISCVKYLMDRECDVHCIDNLGRNSLHKIVRYKPSNQQEVETMEQVISCLIQKNLDVNSKDNCGDTPLHIAVRANSVWGVRLLIEKKPNVNITNNNGETPLHNAIIVGRDVDNSNIQYAIIQAKLKKTII